MNKKIIKKMLILIALVMILFAIYKIIQIYAVFYNEAQGNMQEKIANLTVYVNNTDITTAQVENFVIDTFNLEKNEHVKDGKLAPGLAGDFHSTIEPSNTNVAIKYELQIKKENLVNSKAQLISIEETQNNKPLVRTGENSYTGLISLADIQAGKKDVIKIKVQWSDTGETDKEDTQIGTVKNPKIEIPITVNATQYLGEEITPYE